MNTTAKITILTTNLRSTWRHPAVILHAWKNRYTAAFFIRWQLK